MEVDEEDLFGVKDYFEWEPNVLCKKQPSDYGFTYVTKRFRQIVDESGQPRMQFEDEPTPGRPQGPPKSRPRCPCTGALRREHCLKGFCPGQCIPKGVQVPLLVTETQNGRGLGLIALDAIPQGAFIATYVGELISFNEARRREEMYRQESLYYLHDVTLSVGSREVVFALDPTHMGNLGRLLNHSCTPNLCTFEVPTVSPSDLVLTKRGRCKQNGVPSITDDDIWDYLPRVSFFTLRDVEMGEELLIDYSPGRHFYSQLRKEIRCQCGSPLCKGWLF
eukprot:jgi/Mesvir1/12919/Mv05938-RA.1